MLENIDTAENTDVNSMTETSTANELTFKLNEEARHHNTHIDIRNDAMQFIDKESLSFISYPPPRFWGE